MKKGFTLIELLAVIVILAIIALIASPIIIGLIDDARKESFKSSAYGIVRAGEIFFSQNLLSGTNEEVTFTYTDGVESSSISGKKLDYNGSKPNSGEVKVNKNGEVAIAVHNGTYCAEKGYNESELTISNKTVVDCKIPSEIPKVACMFRANDGWSVIVKLYDINDNLLGEATSYANPILYNCEIGTTYKVYYDALQQLTIDGVEVLSYGVLTGNTPSHINIISSTGDTTGGETSITFQVVENPTTTPVTFDGMFND